jgi:hypothetical protein
MENWLEAGRRGRRGRGRGRGGGRGRGRGVLGGPRYPPGEHNTSENMETPRDSTKPPPSTGWGHIFVDGVPGFVERKDWQEHIISICKLRVAPQTKWLNFGTYSIKHPAIKRIERALSELGWYEAVIVPRKGQQAFLAGKDHGDIKSVFIGGDNVTEDIRMKARPNGVVFEFKSKKVADDALTLGVTVNGMSRPIQPYLPGREFLQRKQLADAIGKRSNAVLDNVVTLRTLFVIMSQSMDNETQDRFLVNVQACPTLDFSTREMISRSLDRDYNPKPTWADMARNTQDCRAQGSPSRSVATVSDEIKDVVMSEKDNRSDGSIETTLPEWALEKGEQPNDHEEPCLTPAPKKTITSTCPASGLGNKRKPDRSPEESLRDPKRTDNTISPQTAKTLAESEHVDCVSSQVTATSDDRHLDDCMCVKCGQLEDSPDFPRSIE